jgi:hypothetical protein
MERLVKVTKIFGNETIYQSEILIRFTLKRAFKICHYASATGRVARTVPDRCGLNVPSKYFNARPAEIHANR